MIRGLMILTAATVMAARAIAVGLVIAAVVTWAWFAVTMLDLMGFGGWR